MFCREQAALLKPLVAPLHSMGCRVVAIGNGIPIMAQDFVEQFEIPYPVYTDPTAETYKVLGMHKGLGIGLGTIRSAFSVRKNGFSQGKVAGDPFQQGGEAFINANGEILWINRCRTAEEHTSPAEILQTAQQLFTIN